MAHLGDGRTNTAGMTEEDSLGEIDDLLGGIDLGDGGLRQVCTPACSAACREPSLSPRLTRGALARSLCVARHSRRSTRGRRWPSTSARRTSSSGSRTHCAGRDCHRASSRRQDAGHLGAALRVARRREAPAASGAGCSPVSGPGRRPAGTAAAARPQRRAAGKHLPLCRSCRREKPSSARAPRRARGRPPRPPSAGRTRTAAVGWTSGRSSSDSRTSAWMVCRRSISPAFSRRLT